MMSVIRQMKQKEAVPEAVSNKIFECKKLNFSNIKEIIKIQITKR